MTAPWKVDMATEATITAMAARIAGLEEELKDCRAREKDAMMTAHNRIIENIMKGNPILETLNEKLKKAEIDLAKRINDNLGTRS